MTSVTFCPSRPAHQILKAEPQWHHYAKTVSPVSFDDEGTAHSQSGLSFSDCERMHGETHCLAPGRHGPPPELATNDCQLKKLLVLYWENRASRTAITELPNG